MRLRSLKKGGENFANWLQRKLDPALMIEYFDFECDGRAFAIMCIGPTYDRPVTFDGVAYIRIGENKKKLADFKEHERALWLATGRRRFEQAIAMSSASLRERFSLPQDEYQAVSTIITSMVRAKRILPADSAQGKRVAKYIPYWAR